MNNAIRHKPFDMQPGKLMGSMVADRNKFFGIMIIGALIAFEVFNFSTTEFALGDVLGPLNFLGLKWSTILSIAFCGIDFAGVARLFTPEQGSNEPTEVWYLFGAWILAAAMNASLTWWGVSVAIASHVSQGASVINSQTIQTIVPIFVAVMVWVIRILIIGTFSMAGERMFGQTDTRARRNIPQTTQTLAPRTEYQNQRPTTVTTPVYSAKPAANQTTSFKPQPRPVQFTENNTNNARPIEPTYHNLASNKNVQEYEDR